MSVVQTTQSMGSRDPRSTHAGSQTRSTGPSARGVAGAGGDSRQDRVGKKAKWRIDSDLVWQNFAEHIGQLRLAGKRPEVEIRPDGRTVDQNDMIHALYRQIASQSDDQGFIEVRRYCKLHYGVPMLRAASEVFRYVYDHAIKPLDYEFKLKAMDVLPVTSELGKRDAMEFIDTVIREYSARGFSLVHPSETDW